MGGLGRALILRREGMGGGEEGRGGGGGEEGRREGGRGVCVCLSAFMS